jgi:hypothetical protein
MMRRALFLPAVVLLLAAAAAADEPKVITPAEARDHLDQVCSVEYVVKSGRLLSGQGVCFLNSEDDHRSPENFTAVIYSAGLAEFEQQNIGDPSDYFRAKKIRVTGKIALHQDKLQIVVTEAKQIALVKDQDR